MSYKPSDITVTRPLMPDLEELHAMLREIWSTRRLTNNGPFHGRLEAALAERLGVPYISLFTNGTLPLITALQALQIKGEVITTPYSFVATTHAIWWNGLTPAFADVDPTTGNLDPDRLEEVITPATAAIMPVHVYGNPCDTERIAEIARRHNLPVIYDAAHAFGVERNGHSILLEGDFSTLSFHATKIFNTVEGGAMVIHDADTKRRIDQLKNFGFASETEVTGPGINSKMDEIRAAYGLLNLRRIDEAIARCGAIVATYREHLADIPGISFMQPMKDVTPNNSYFPIFVEAEAYGRSRDELYFHLREHQILGRRYFYPLISEFSPYRSLPSANPANLPVATSLSRSVICLPVYPDLPPAVAERIAALIRGFGK